MFAAATALAACVLVADIGVAAASVESDDVCEIVGASLDWDWTEHRLEWFSPLWFEAKTRVRHLRHDVVHCNVERRRELVWSWRKTYWD